MIDLRFSNDWLIRNRFIYTLHCTSGPGLNMPMLLDVSGFFLRREGLYGNYICSTIPPLVCILDLLQDDLMPSECVHSNMNPSLGTEIDIRASVNTSSCVFQWQLTCKFHLYKKFLCWSCFCPTCTK